MLAMSERLGPQSIFDFTLVATNEYEIVSSGLNEFQGWQYQRVREKAGFA